MIALFIFIGVWIWIILELINSPEDNSEDGR
jgi:hypothetical protein